jgi:hypothetical protein
MDSILAIKVALSVVIYCLSVAAVPIYNKKIFSGTICPSGRCLKSFPYPITTAFLQLGFVSVVLAFASIVSHVSSRRSRAEGRSWIFGPHFGYKLRHIAPVGVLFGVKYGITNWGLALVPTAKHLLLQSTDLVWTIIFARFINKERLGVFEGIAAAFSVAGAVFVSLGAGGELEAPVLGLTVNLLTPIFLALCITTLRTGAAEIFRKDNCVQGTVTPAEFTAIKLALSSLVAFVLALCLENEGVQWLEGKKDPKSWWIALDHYPLDSTVALFGGALFVLIFQVNITWLAGLTSAVAVGIVGEVKVVPQWIMNGLFNTSSVDFSPQNIWGAVLSLAGSVVFAASASLRWKLEFSRRGFEWQLRDATEKLLESTSTSLQSHAAEEQQP